VFKQYFINKHFRIKVSTDSQKILSLLSNYLDFKETKSGGQSFHIELYITCKGRRGHAYWKERSFTYPSSTIKGKTGAKAFFVPTRMAEFKVDYNRGKIISKILCYENPFKESLVNFVFFEPIRMILAKKGFHFLHASMVSFDDCCVLICGPQDSGKSVTALALIKKDFSLLCDDYSFVRSNDGSLSFTMLPTKMGVREPKLPVWRNLSKNLRKDFYYGGKHRVSLLHLYGSLRLRYRRTFILFPQYNCAVLPCLCSLPKQEALKRLLLENAYDKFRGTNREALAKTFFVFQDLVTKSQCLELIYNDKNLGQAAQIFRDKYFYLDRARRRLF